MISMNALYHEQQANAPDPEIEPRLAAKPRRTKGDICKDTPEQYAARREYAIWANSVQGRSKSNLWARLVASDGAQRLGELLAFMSMPGKDLKPKTAIAGVVVIRDEELARKLQEFGLYQRREKPYNARTIYRWRKELEKVGILEAHKHLIGFKDYKNSNGKIGNAMLYRLDFVKINAYRILYVE